jgi:hypothetical protein
MKNNKSAFNLFATAFRQKRRQYGTMFLSRIKELIMLIHTFTRCLILFAVLGVPLAAGAAPVSTDIQPAAAVTEEVQRWHNNSNYPYLSRNAQQGTFADLSSARAIDVDSEGITVQFKTYTLSESDVQADRTEMPAKTPFEYHGLYLKKRQGDRQLTFDIYYDGEKIEEDELLHSGKGQALAQVGTAAVERLGAEKRTADGYYPYGSFPSVYVLHHAVNGELPVSPLECSVIPRQDKVILAEPRSDSYPLGVINAGSSSRIVDYELHTYPRRYLYSYEGKLYGFLAYRGEGVYSVVAEGGRIGLLRTNSNQIYTHSDLWLCVRNANGVEGWVKFENQNDWVRSKNGIFHTVKTEEV